MARIDLNDFDRIEKERASLQDCVPAAYSISKINGEKYLQIETYGRNGSSRKNSSHPTQVLQLDRKTLETILRIAKENEII